MNEVSIKPGAVQSSLPPTSIVISKLVCQRHRDARLEYGGLVSFPGLRSGPPPQNRSRSCAMIRAGESGGRHSAEAVQGAEQIIGKLREEEVALTQSEGVG